MLLPDALLQVFKPIRAIFFSNADDRLQIKCIGYTQRPKIVTGIIVVKAFGTFVSEVSINILMMMLLKRHQQTN
jgi:hypothetical protein